MMSFQPRSWKLIISQMTVYKVKRKKYNGMGEGWREFHPSLTTAIHAYRLKQLTKTIKTSTLFLTLQNSH
jgi:hypothetical protein